MSEQWEESASRLKTPGAPDTSRAPSDTASSVASDLAHSITAAARLPTGSMLNGRYRVESKLGEGGQGEVYRCSDSVLGTTVAVKVLPAAVCQDSSSIARLKREALVALTLTHANIVRLMTFEQSSDGGSAFLVMQFVEGVSLAERIRQSPGGMEADAVDAIARQIGSAIDHAHSLSPPVLHRDIKPGNILLGRAGRAYLTDFGVAFEIHSSLSQVTGVSWRAGTPRYMSPQHIVGERPTKADDIYSFAVTLYEMLAGSPPFVRGDVFSQIQSMAPPIVEGLSGRVNAVLQRALAKDVTARPRTAMELVGLLGAALEEMRSQAVAGRKIAPPRPTLEARAEAGESGAQIVMAERALREGSSEGATEAAKWLRRAAKSGDVVARFRLAELFLQGLATPLATENVDQLLLGAAEEGYSPAQFRMGVRLLDADKSRRDLPGAVAWFRRAADQRYVPAMAALSRCYRDGIGVRKNKLAARGWGRAAIAGDFTAPDLEDVGGPAWGVLFRILRALRLR